MPTVTCHDQAAWSWLLLGPVGVGQGPCCISCDGTDDRGFWSLMTDGVLVSW